MTEQESKDLRIEIAHIFDSGANEMRIFNMIEMFLDRRDKAINYTHCCTELKDKTGYNNIDDIDPSWIEYINGNKKTL